MASFPDYLSSMHRGLLTGSKSNDTFEPLYPVSRIYNELVNQGNVPKMDEAYTSPDFAASLIRSNMVNLDSRISSFDPISIWKGYISEVLSTLGASTLFRDIDIDNIVNSALNATGDVVNSVVSQAVAFVDQGALSNIIDGFKQRLSIEKLRSFRRVSGHFSESNSVTSSTYVMAKALIESQYIASVAEFSGQLTIEQTGKGFDITADTYRQVLTNTLNAAIQDKQIKDRTTSESVKYALDLYATRLNLVTRRVELGMEEGKFNYMARNEWDANRRASLLGEQHWRLDLAAKVSAITAAPLTGIAAQRDEPSKFQSAVGGVLMGAGTGMSIGKNFGGQGAAIGAGAGALLGLVAGLSA